jgi:hypothetical protein
MIDPTEPDDLAFWRGLVIGGCISACIWIAAFGGIWAWAKGVM